MADQNTKHRQTDGSASHGAGCSCRHGGECDCSPAPAQATGIGQNVDARA